MKDQLTKFEDISNVDYTHTFEIGIQHLYKTIPHKYFLYNLSKKGGGGKTNCTCCTVFAYGHF